MHRLIHQQRPPQISPTLSGNPRLQPRTALQTLLIAHALQHALNLLYRRRRDSDQQATTPDGRDDIARAVGEEDQTEVGRVLLHRPAQRGLRVAREVVGFVDHDDFEALLGGQVDLLRLRDFFQQVLDHHAVVVANVRGRNFEVVVGGYECEFELAVAVVRRCS